MQMTRKMALLDFTRCNPGVCNHGICKAAEACPAGLLRQESPYQTPMPEPSFCRACGDCVRACPLQAIKLVSM